MVIQLANVVIPIAVSVSPEVLFDMGVSVATAAEVVALLLLLVPFAVVASVVSVLGAGGLVVERVVVRGGLVTLGVLVVVLRLSVGPIQ